MSLSEHELATYFESSERHKGEEFLRKQLVVISSASDLDVRAFVKGSASARVTLSASEVGDSAFAADCTCPRSRKGHACRHIWAVLRRLEDSRADFLEGKLELRTSAGPPSARDEKITEFKKQQKQKMKARVQESRAKTKAAARGPRFLYPAPVQEALDYFRANGFALEEFDKSSLLNARKLLARVFHPDKGGTHEEVLELNAHFDTLEDYLNS